MVRQAQTGLEVRLRNAVVGAIHFDAFTRGRYATDASQYQIMPVGVVVPRTIGAAVRTFALAREEGIPVTARGGGTSQSGQAINCGLVVDGSKHLRRMLELDLGTAAARSNQASCLPRRRELTEQLLAIGMREADEVAARFPKLQRRVGGYNLGALDPRHSTLNLAHILVGSEGTLA